MIPVKEAAETLGISLKELMRKIDDGDLVSFQLGRQYYVQRQDIAVLAKAKGLTVLDDEPVDDLPVSELLHHGGIFHDIPGDHKTEVLRDLLQRIHGVDHEQMGPIFEAFLRRETIGSTNIGSGIALPHARDVLIGCHPHPLLALGFTRGPVEWDPSDPTPVRAVFTMITPNGQTHLRILGSLARILEAPSCRNAVNRQAPAAEIREVFRAVESSFRDKRS
jgi:nitrogen PTS system EIIA component